MRLLLDLFLKRTIMKVYTFFSLGYWAASEPSSVGVSTVLGLYESA